MRAALLVTAAAVVLTPLVAEAAPSAPKNRVATGSYVAAAGLQHPRATADVGCIGFPTLSVRGRRVTPCASFDSLKGEKSLVVSAADDTGLTVGMFVRVGNGPAKLFCGSAKVSLPASTSVPVTVGAFSAAGCSVVTTGTITATFSR